MDYKELIEQLRSASILHGTWLRERMLEAATAIETLLEERDAAVKELRYMGCTVCRYRKVDWHEEPCYSCHRVEGGKERWEWRGPQKESGNDGKA